MGAVTRSKELKENSGFTVNNSFGNTAGIITNHRTAMSLGLDRNNTEVFIVGRENIGISLGKELDFLVLGNFSQEFNSRASDFFEFSFKASEIATKDLERKLELVASLDGDVVAFG